LTEFDTLLFTLSYVVFRHLTSFPTRRSSDLGYCHIGLLRTAIILIVEMDIPLTEVSFGNIGIGGMTRSQLGQHLERFVLIPFHIDRKSTRLNSSHVKISYAVFCLKKKTDVKN